MFDRARELDAADPLASYRDRFVLPEDTIYLDGNSLGCLPKDTPARIAEVVAHEWGRDLIGSWNTADWIVMPQRIGGKIAPLIGAAPHEVIACDTVSVNLFKLIAAALKMQPGRKVVLSEPGNFPTDLYMIEGLERQGLAQRRLAERDRVAEALDGDVALLSHSVGAMPVDLDGCGADFAVGCGYKYLNGGPGAPAFAYVAQRHHDALAQPLTGWMGHAKPFEFLDDYTPAPGTDRLLCGTPPILGLSALEVGVDLIAEIGVGRLHEKSQALSEFFRECLADRGIDLELVSPDDPKRRGSHLSFAHENAYALSRTWPKRRGIWPKCWRPANGSAPNSANDPP